ncbi:MAG: TM2 domain-containing protein [Propionibacteriaceae bacterium]|nr:TM2 domain-containing protein [Propionibacteriaceae bacterium]
MEAQAGGWGTPQPSTPPSQPVSKTTAALLAFLLGWAGAHNFYLNQRARGVAHLLLFGLSMLGFLGVGAYTLFMIFWYSDLYLGHEMDGTQELILSAGMILSFGLLIVDVLWAVIEGIIILARPQPLLPSSR